MAKVAPWQPLCDVASMDAAAGMTTLTEFPGATEIVETGQTRRHRDAGVRAAAGPAGPSDSPVAADAGDGHGVAIGVVAVSRGGRRVPPGKSSFVYGARGLQDRDRRRRADGRRSGSRTRGREVGIRRPHAQSHEQCGDGPNERKGIPPHGVTTEQLVRESW